MKLPLIIVSLFLIISSVSAIDSATSETSVNLKGGALIIHGDYESVATSGSTGFITGGENWNSHAAGKQVVTLGYSSYSDKTTANSRVKNTYVTDDVLIGYKGSAAAAYNTYVMEDNKANIPDESCDAAGAATGATVSANGSVIDGQYPSHQTAEVYYELMGNDGFEYGTSAVINDANLTTSLSAAGNEGMAGASIRYKSEAGFRKDTPNMNFEKSGSTRYMAYNMNGTGFEVPLDWEWSDHSRPFETLTNVSRLTIGNETVNLT